MKLKIFKKDAKKGKEFLYYTLYQKSAKKNLFKNYIINPEIKELN